MNGLHSINGVKEMSPSKVKSSKTIDAKNEKQIAQEKLHDCIKELHKSCKKTRDVFGSFKTKCFFFPEPEFNKAFTESLKQVEIAIDAMGNKVSALFGGKSKSIAGEGEEVTKVKPSLKSEHVDSTFSLNTDTNDVMAKASLNITPPASEAGNDDEVTLGKQQPLRNSGKKRTRCQEDSNKNTKKPRRSLIDDYAAKEDVSIASTDEAKETTDDPRVPDVEAEYEVENIIDFKKVQGEFYYKVSWKGYPLDESTWEPTGNLTDCEEVLVEFYKKRLIEREKSNSNELNNQLMPLDFTHKKYLHEALKFHVMRHSQIDKKQVCRQFFSKPPATTKIEVDDLLGKLLTVRKVERYSTICQMLVEQLLVQDVQQEREQQLAKLRTWERNMNSVCSDPAKIVVENFVDLELPPLDFIYINELKAGTGVTIPNDPILGCECKDCFNSQTTCCASQMSSWFAYNKFGRLKVSLGTPIYECNKRCHCPSTCNNRVVQKGRCFSLSIFRTPNGRGWGVKALEAIKKDSFVVEYVGEVITSEEAEHRGHIYDKKGCTYLFDLDFNKGDQNPYTVDAAKYGNISHFINHSCDPNLVVFNVWVNCLDPDLPRLALFSCRDIKKGEELTFDYNSGLGPDQMDSSSVLCEEFAEEDVTTPDKGEITRGMNSSFIKTPKGNRGLKYGKTECRCGAANCRKYFF